MINYILPIVIAAAVVLAVLKLRKQRKQGGCTGGCAACSRGLQPTPE